MAGAYRRHFGLFICSGVLFNHESPRRPLKYVSQKIAYAAACVRLGFSTSEALDERGAPIVSESRVCLGNLEVRRDFGFAGDYVKAMWLMLQNELPDDYVIGTGIPHSIQEMCEVAFSHVDRDWRDHVVVDPNLVRSIDSRHTVADSTKAASRLGWKPAMTFQTLMETMVDFQIDLMRAGAAASHT
jgi:GDPmannose 4,6-dehydratase